ncbi:MAG: trimethylamine methyltransferase family protein [Thermoleophilia bacterium]
MDSPHAFVPTTRLSHLDEEAKSRIFEAALRVLAEVGASVQHAEGARLLQEAGCTLGADGLVRVPREAVERARTTAPSSFRLYGRDGSAAMELGGHNVFFGTGSDLMWQHDLETGEHRSSRLDDIARVARLCDALPHMDFVMSGAYPTELDPRGVYAATFLTMMRNCRKPLVIVAENEVDLGAIMGMAADLRGGAAQLRERPYFLAYVEPVSPLSHSAESVAKLLLCADAGVPVAYVPAPLLGATSPVSTAGHVVQGMAECLLGLVLHQHRAPGAPFMFGVNQGILDMVSGQPSYTAVEGFMNYLTVVEMAKWLDLPNWGISGCTDSQAIDAQLGLEAGELTLLSMLLGSNLNHDVGFMGFGLTGSLEEIVITDEFVSMNKKLLGGIPLEEVDLAVDVIADVGPKGHFLAHPHTRAYLRKGPGQWRPGLLNRDNRDRWVEAGGLDLREKARRKALALLAAGSVDDLEPALLASCEARVAALTTASDVEVR